MHETSICYAMNTMLVCSVQVYEILLCHICYNIMFTKRTKVWLALYIHVVIESYGDLMHFVFHFYQDTSPVMISTTLTLWYYVHHSIMRVPFPLRLFRQCECTPAEGQVQWYIYEPAWSPCSSAWVMSREVLHIQFGLNWKVETKTRMF